MGSVNICQLYFNHNCKQKAIISNATRGTRYYGFKQLFVTFKCRRIKTIVCYTDRQRITFWLDLCGIGRKFQAILMIWSFNVTDSAFFFRRSTFCFKHCVNQFGFRCSPHICIVRFGVLALHTIRLFWFSEIRISLGANSMWHCNVRRQVQSQGTWTDKYLSTDLTMNLKVIWKTYNISKKILLFY